MWSCVFSIFIAYFCKINSDNRINDFIVRKFTNLYTHERYHIFTNIYCSHQIKELLDFLKLEEHYMMYIVLTSILPFGK